MKEITYFIDETGSTGDLIKAGSGLSFNNQPYFALGSIGVDDEKILKVENKIAALKADNKINANNLKSTTIYKKKPKFILDLVNVIINEKIPFFIELVEKKYFIASNISFYLFLPPYFTNENKDKSEEARCYYLRNTFSKMIARDAPDEIFEKYLSACLNQSKESLLEAFSSLLEFCKSKAKSDSEYKDFHLMVEESIDDFNKTIEILGSESKAVAAFTPVPDISKKDRPIYILPNYSSLTNIYARINLFHGQKVGNIKLVHDRHEHYDLIFKDAKKIAENEKFGVGITPNSNYDFIEKADLSFKKSAETIGIQIVDILVGFVARYCEDRTLKDEEPNEQLIEAFRKLFYYSLGKNFGINFVWSKNKIEFGKNAVCEPSWLL